MRIYTLAHCICTITVEYNGTIKVMAYVSNVLYRNLFLLMRMVKLFLNVLHLSLHNTQLLF